MQDTNKKENLYTVYIQCYFWFVYGFYGALVRSEESFFLALFLSFLARIFFYPASFFLFLFLFLLFVWEAGGGEMDSEKRSKKDTLVWD